MNQVQDAFQTISVGFVSSALVVCIFTLLWMRSIQRFFRDDLDKPLSEISNNISSIQNGQYSLYSENASSKEMAEIYQALEELASRVRYTIALEKENAALEKKLALSELRMLQNQINPHFLFNTLNMIYCLCQTGDSETAGEMIFRTSHLLRYCLDKQSRISTLDQEVNALQDYMEIQSKRLSGKVTFSLETDPDPSWRAVPVPAMILQPLVEKSILHGLKDCMQGGMVQVSIVCQKGMTEIVILDNGTGFEPAGPVTELDTDGEKKSTGLGLFNVMHRLEMLYQDRFSYEIDSAPQKGCRITMRLKEEVFHVCHSDC